MRPTKGGSGILNIELNRDGLDSPWGFRLKGGRDVDGGTPLEVIKVSLGSACEGVLRVGDKLATINGVDSKRLTHAEAQEVFRRAGNSLLLGIIRSGKIPDYSSHSSSVLSPTMILHQNMSVHQQTNPACNMPISQKLTNSLPNRPKVANYNSRLRGQNIAPSTNSLPRPSRCVPAFMDTNVGYNNNYNSSSHRTRSASEARNVVVEAIANQPFRTTPLVLPGAKSAYEKVDGSKSGNCDLPMTAQHRGPASSSSTHNNSSSYFYNNSNSSMNMDQKPVGIDHQPFRTAPLVTPAPRTLNESADRAHVDLGPVTAPPYLPHNVAHNPHGPNITNAKTIDIGGVKKQVVTQQFNSPLGLYSDETIADAVINSHPDHQMSSSTAPDGTPHPGFVPSSKLHLPAPKDGMFSRPQQSPTFRLILESEMDKAKDQQKIYGSEFHGQHSGSRPNSQGGHAPATDPVMFDNSISQSASFRRVMQSMAGGGPGSDF